VEIDLLVAEPEGDTVLAEGLETHPEDARVEVDAAIPVMRGQDQVIEMVDQGPALRRAVGRLTSA
jgi:hypothetical protein